MMFGSCVAAGDFTHTPRQKSARESLFHVLFHRLEGAAQFNWFPEQMPAFSRADCLLNMLFRSWS